MKRILSLVLSLTLLLLLTACGAEDADDRADSSQTDVPETATAMRWNSSTLQLRPFGYGGQVEALAAGDGKLYAAGEKDGSLTLTSLAYKLEDGKLSFEEPCPLALPEDTDQFRVAGLSCLDGKLYLLLCPPEGYGSPYAFYQLLILSSDGSLAERIELDLGPDAFAQDILVFPDGRFCIRCADCLRTFEADGTPHCVHVLSGELSQAFLLDGRLAVQSIDGDSGIPQLSMADEELESFLPLGLSSQLGPLVSCAGSPEGPACLNTGAELVSLSPDGTVSQVFDWYQLTGDYGYNYSRVLPLDESNYLLLESGSGQLQQLHIEQVPDTRRELRVALYSQNTLTLDQLSRTLEQVSPDYRIELSSYDSGQEGLVRLMADLESGEGPELIISEAYLLDPSIGADLYPFIDADGELNRESFLPLMLRSLERDGELRQIWGCFGLSSFLAFGPLAQAPEDISLAECGAYLAEQGYTEPLFDSYMTGEQFLSNLAFSLIDQAWNEEAGAYELDSESLRETLELCASLPREFDAENIEDMVNSQVLSYRDISLEYMNFLDSQDTAYRFLGNSENSLSTVSAYYRSSYMIPQGCEDKEKVWAFLRELLSPEYQLELCSNGYSGYPTNNEALDRVLRDFISPEAGQELLNLVDAAAVSNYDAYQMKTIFLDSLRPWLYGDYDLDQAIAAAQSKINLYQAERGS